MVVEMRGYKFLEHTADIKVEAWGDSLEEAFEAAAMALTDISVDRDKVDKKIVKNIKVEGFDLESLLYNWIEELIVTLDIEKIVFNDFKVVITGEPDNYKLSAEAYGEKYSKNKHGYKVHVKAMTYHEMEIKEYDGKYIIRYVVDI